MASSFADSYVKWAQRLLPMPFTIAALLTVLTFLLALIFSSGSGESSHVVELLGFWEAGMWNRGGMVFTFQMMLILVLGHVLALTPVAEKFIAWCLRFCRDTASSAAVVAMVTMMAAYLNWGLGLVFGAIFARKVGEYARSKSIPINYPLIGAAGYVGLMVWHGGLSGSAPVTVNGSDHNLVDTIGVIPLQQTIGSAMNITAVLLTLCLIPALLYIVGKRSTSASYALPAQAAKSEDKSPKQWAEKLDYSIIPVLIFGGLMLAVSLLNFLESEHKAQLRFLTLDWINLFLFGAALILHGSFASFVSAVDDAIRGAAGIAIQFPLYFGIMGIMNGSGLISEFAAFFVQISNATTFPLFSFFSAGLVNVFVPSGGGQWQVQGPILIEAGRSLGVSDWKTVMALSYGDQLTNMLQPFWALPLLGITGLKAKQILPYTLMLMLAGVVIFASLLLIF